MTSTSNILNQWHFASQLTAKLQLCKSALTWIGKETQHAHLSADIRSTWRQSTYRETYELTFQFPPCTLIRAVDFSRSYTVTTGTEGKRWGGNCRRDILPDYYWYVLVYLDWGKPALYGELRIGTN